MSRDDILNEIKARAPFDGDIVNKVVKEAGDELYTFVQTNNTPMQNYLDDQSVDYRKFSSLDVNQSPDNIYYKNVESNPEDTIDKMVLFNYGSKDPGETLFSTHAFNPYGV
jgi:hypothetical protein